MRFETHSWVLWAQPTPASATETGLSGEQILTLVFAGLSVVVAGIGAWLANQRAKAGEKVAREALADARLARKEAVELTLWTSALEAVNRFLPFDPATENIGTRNQDLRVRLTLLVDHFHEWEGLDDWLSEEIVLGAATGRAAMESHRPGESVDDQLARLEDYVLWAVVLTKNLRFLRRVGYKPKHIKFLRDRARERREALYAAHSWGPMPTDIPRIEELDESLLEDD